MRMRFLRNRGERARTRNLNVLRRHSGSNWANPVEEHLAAHNTDALSSRTRSRKFALNRQNQTYRRNLSRRAQTCRNEDNTTFARLDPSRARMGSLDFDALESNN